MVLVYGSCLVGVAYDISFDECRVPTCLHAQRIRKAHFNFSGRQVRAICLHHDAMSGGFVMPHHLARSLQPRPLRYAFTQRLVHGVCHVGGGGGGGQPRVEAAAASRAQNSCVTHTHTHNDALGPHVESTLTLATSVRTAALHKLSSYHASRSSQRAPCAPCGLTASLACVLPPA